MMNVKRVTNPANPHLTYFMIEDPEHVLFREPYLGWD